MKKLFPRLALAILCSLFFAGVASALPQNSDAGQNEFEKSIDSVVRNKQYYKTGKFEIGGAAGFMPYDQLMTHYTVGGRLTWHFSDHYGWEVADVQLSLPSVTSFTTGQVSEKGLTNGIQAQKLKLLAASNFVVSPLYGKFRFLGASVIHFDVYLLGGLGFAQGDIAKYSTTGAGGAVTETILSSGGNLMVDFGFGIKLFLNNAMGLVVDFRDYVTMTTLYGSTNPKSNFSVNLGICFFLPTFG